MHSVTIITTASNATPLSPPIPQLQPLPSYQLQPSLPAPITTALYNTHLWRHRPCYTLNHKLYNYWQLSHRRTIHITRSTPEYSHLLYYNAISSTAPKLPTLPQYTAAFNAIYAIDGVKAVVDNLFFGQGPLIGFLNHSGAKQLR